MIERFVVFFSNLIDVNSNRWYVSFCYWCSMILNIELHNSNLGSFTFFCIKCAIFEILSIAITQWRYLKFLYPYSKYELCIVRMFYYKMFDTHMTFGGKKPYFHRELHNKTFNYSLYKHKFQNNLNLVCKNFQKKLCMLTHSQMWV